MPILPMTTESWQQAAYALSSGVVIAVPTDTVYGVACDPYNPSAIELLYSAKGRDREKAIPLLLSGSHMLEQVATSFPETAQWLGAALWPGALTLVVPRRPELPRELSGSDTIAVRVPNHNELRAFIDSVGGAIAATSANLSGKPDALTAEQVEEYLGSAVSLTIDGGRVSGGVPSTVVSCVTDVPTILRQGAISRERIRDILGMEPQ